MNYLIIENNIISNIIVAEPDVAAEFGAVPTYPGAAIGEPYAPPRVYTPLELAQIEITELQLSDIEQGQTVTELELMILGGR